jgi:hypothetical protein
MIKKKVVIIKKRDLIFPTMEKLKDKDNFTALELLRICLHHKIVVRGDKTVMCKALLKKLYNIDQKDYLSLIGRTLIQYFLWKIGNGNNVSKSINIDDFYSTVLVKDISPIFIYCCGEKKVYSFDIRSLDLFRSSGTVFRNPYTDEFFSSEETDAIDRKIKWIKRLGFYISKLVKKTTDPRQYTINIFSYINNHQYVDYNWFLNLDICGLKDLYRELYEIWDYRIPMDRMYKSELVKGDIFSNWTSVRRYRSSMLNKLRLELLKNIEKLVTDGETEDHRKAGCYIFMLGLVLVSEDAATSNPVLYQAAHHADD